MDYLRFNRARILADAIIIIAWVLVTSTIFGWLGLPRWLLYIVIATGVVIYSRITPTWERPSRSPDLPPEDPA